MKTQTNAAQQTEKKSVGSTIGTIVLVICILIAIFAGYSAYATKAGNGVPSVFGFCPFAVQSDSMVPTFKAGDLIIDNPVKDVNELKEGDVITFWTIINGQKVLNTHRIVGIEDGGNFLYFETRGDNNPVDDSTTVHQNDIVGIYKFKISNLGTVLDFLQTTVGFGLCVVLPVAIFFIFEIVSFFKTLMAYKEEKLKLEYADQMSAQGMVNGQQFTPEQMQQMQQQYQQMLQQQAQQQAPVQPAQAAPIQQPQQFAEPTPAPQAAPAVEDPFADAFAQFKPNAETEDSFAQSSNTETTEK